jgi:hypothetical protein
LIKVEKFNFESVQTTKLYILWTEGVLHPIHRDGSSGGAYGSRGPYRWKSNGAPPTNLRKKNERKKG